MSQARLVCQCSLLIAQQSLLSQVELGSHEKATTIAACKCKTTQAELQHQVHLQTDVYQWCFASLKSDLLRQVLKSGLIAEGY